MRAKAEKENLPFTDKLEIILSLGSGTNNPGDGEFKLALLGLMKFPGGWRLITRQSIHWVSFPSNIADDKTLREMAILDKAASYKGITGQDDPALLKLGDALVHFIRERDAGIFKKEAYITGDLVWAGWQLSGRKGPSRQELDDHLKTEAQQQMDIARSTVRQMEDAGIDLKNADIQIKEAAVESLHQGHSVSVDGLTGFVVNDNYSF